MYFLVVTKLCFYFLLCEPVRSSPGSFLHDQTLLDDEIDDVLVKFFAEIKKVYLPEFKFRHITIVGGKTKYLLKVESLIDGYPNIICADTEKCAYREEFSRGNFVIIFLDDSSEKAFEKNVELLSRCRKCTILFMSGGVVQPRDVWFIFNLAMKHNIQFSELAHHEKNAIQLYRNYIGDNCSMGVELTIVWRPGVTLTKMGSWAFRIHDLNGCPVPVSSSTFAPKLFIEENKNGSLIVRGGLEGKLLLALASKLNFTIKLRYPSAEDQLKYSRKVAILNDVASDISEIGIGRLRPTNRLHDKIAVSFPYDNECVTWGVPRVMNWSDDIVYVEFSWEVWVSVGLIFAISCVIGYVHRSIISLESGRRTPQGFVTIFLDAVAIHLGQPVIYVSSSAGGRLMLVAYLYYAMVITTAYKISLASILATDKSTPRIFDDQGIIKANLNVGGSLYEYNILMDQVNEGKFTSKLLERFVVNNNNSQTWDQLVLDHNYAFLARRSSLNYKRGMIVKAHKPVTFNVFNSCVLAYHTVIAFKEKSFLRKSMNNLIMQLAESGILGHWDIDEFDTDKIPEPQATYKYRYIFILYSGCIAMCLVIFLIELFIQKLVSI